MFADVVFEVDDEVEVPEILKFFDLVVVIIAHRFAKVLDNIILNRKPIIVHLVA